MRPACVELQPMTLLLFIVAMIFLLAGFIKGVIGLGLPTVAMGLLALVMAPAQAAAILILPSLITNVWQMIAGPALRSLLLRLWPMQAGVVAGVLSGSGWMTSSDGVRWGGLLLGVALLLYATSGLSGRRVTVARHVEPWLGPLTGLLTGLLTAATGVFVIPAVPYLQGLGLERDELVQALGLSFTVSTVALGLNVAMAGALAPEQAGAILLALLAALAGMAAGQRVRGWLDPQRFRRWFFAGLMALGAALVFRALA